MFKRILAANYRQVIKTFNLLCEGERTFGVPALFIVVALSVVPTLGWVPKIVAIVFSSGGGIGYIPIAISTRDKPNDQISLCTE